MSSFFFSFPSLTRQVQPEIVSIPHNQFRPPLVSFQQPNTCRVSQLLMNRWLPSACPVMDHLTNSEILLFPSKSERPSKTPDLWRSPASILAHRTLNYSPIPGLVYSHSFSVRDEHWWRDSQQTRALWLRTVAMTLPDCREKYRQILIIILHLSPDSADEICLSNHPIHWLVFRKDLIHLRVF